MIGYNSVGLDTGFFQRLLTEHDRTAELSRHITNQEIPTYVSCICIYELIKLRHRNVLDPDTADALLEHIPSAFEIIWLEHSQLIRRAADISHRNKMPMADAFIVASYLEAECQVIYTTDTDFLRYEGESVDIILLE